MKTRASLYTAEIADRILRELRIGRSLHGICCDDGMPHRDTVTKWIRQDRAGFAARYRQAREIAQNSPGYPGYTAETAERLLGELMIGRGLVEICGDPGMPDHTTVNRWVANDREGFAARYRRAREIGRLRNASVPYTPEIAGWILDDLMSGRPLNDICNEPDMPSASAVRNWIKDNREGFAARYREAREVGYDTIGDQMLRIVDDRRNDWITWRREDGTMARMLDPQRVNRALARIKTRCWLLAKMLPKQFGDRPDRKARQQANGGTNSEMAEIMKLIDGRTRGLPSEDEPLDDE
jgi:terminase small subunit-like protein